MTPNPPPRGCYLRPLQLHPSRRRLRAIVTMQVLRDEVLGDQLEAEIGHFNVVIVDEAHHARNPDTQTSEMLRMLGRIAGTLFLLTASPVHLGTWDLFTLLQAMRPAEYTDAQAFDDHLCGHHAMYGAAMRTFSRLYEPNICWTASIRSENRFRHFGSFV